MTGRHPPWLATRLLSAVLPTDGREAVLGDLCEEYGLRATESPQAAGRWYWHQALRSVPTLWGHRVWQDRWISTMAVAGAAYLFVGVINAAGMTIVARWLGDTLSTTRLPAATVGLIAIGSGAHLAARIRPSAGDALGGLVMLVAVLFLVFPVDTAPWWYQLTFLVLGPLAAHLGAAGGLRRTTTGRGRWSWSAQRKGR